MFEQVKLTYDFNALEPHIDELTMDPLRQAPWLYQQPEQRPEKLPGFRGRASKRSSLTWARLKMPPAKDSAQQRRRLLQP